MAPSARQPAACNHALGLHAACSIPSDDGLGQVCRFLHNGADIESLDSEAQPATPLFRAAGAGNALVCEVLLKKGAVVEKGSERATPLHVACFEGFVHVARLLLTHGARVNATTKEGATALLIVCDGEHKFPQAMRQLDVRSVADGGTVNADAATVARRVELVQAAVLAASIRKQLALAELLLSFGADIELVDQEGFSPLYSAACYGHLEVATLLVQRGADVNGTKHKMGFSPLHACSQHGHDQVVKMLLDHGANANSAATEECLTPLYMASQLGKLAVVEVLLAGGACVDLANAAGHTALHIACKEGHTQVAQALLSQGADVNLADEQGQTALYLACQDGRLEVAELLLASGAGVDTPSAHGRTPLRTSVGLAMGSDSAHQFGVVRLLLRHGACISKAGCEGSPPLHLACLNGNVEMVELLLDAGAPINEPDDEGCTPLAMAAAVEQADVAYLLLSRGAELGDSEAVSDEDRAFVDGLRAPAAAAAAAAAVAAPSADAASPSLFAGGADLGDCQATTDQDRASVGGGEAGVASLTTAPAAAPGASQALKPSQAAVTSSDTEARGQEPSLPAAKQCAHCGAPKSASTRLSKCSGCQAVRYCSAACQKLHWREGGHKAACKALRAAALAACP